MMTDRERLDFALYKAQFKLVLCQVMLTENKIKQLIEKILNGDKYSTKTVINTKLHV